MDNKIKKVFLGGTCPGYDWRGDLIPLLKIDYFNPVVDDWNEEAYQRELHEREVDDFCLYVITNGMEGFYSIAEVVDDSKKRPEKTVLCILKDGFNRKQIKSFEAIERMVSGNGGKVCSSLEEVADYLNNGVQQVRNTNTGVMSLGVRCPIIRQGDPLKDIVIGSVLNTLRDNGLSFEDRDVIGITESVVARWHGNYVSVDEVAAKIKEIMGEENTSVTLWNPIYSRNRFSMILKAFARAAENVNIIMPYVDEVGNPSGVNKFTGVDMKEYYKEIVKSEGKTVHIYGNFMDFDDKAEQKGNIMFYCGLHDYKKYEGVAFTLADICKDKCEYGLLGSNKANEETLKLFPDGNIAQKLVLDIQEEIKNKFGVNVEVMVYGDGCFKDPVGGIWEFADPVVSPAHTLGLLGTPNEIKIKAFADDQYANLDGIALTEALKEEIRNKDKNLVGSMASQGTTPRRYTDLLGSLMDLTSGSGDKGTPVVLVKNYFKNYSD